MDLFLLLLPVSISFVCHAAVILLSAFLVCCVVSVSCIVSCAFLFIFFSCHSCSDGRPIRRTASRNCVRSLEIKWPLPNCKENSLLPILPVRPKRNHKDGKDGSMSNRPSSIVDDRLTDPGDKCGQGYDQERSISQRIELATITTTITTAAAIQQHNKERPMI